MINETFRSAIDNNWKSVYQWKQWKYGYRIFFWQKFTTAVNQLHLSHLFFNFFITKRNSNCFGDKTKFQKKTGKEK